MWLATGPFDGEVSGELDFKKTKLLKTGHQYGVGRKERQLLVNHKKVSHSHAEFVVGPYTQDNVSNPQIVPKLEFCNIKNKPMTLKRGEDVVVINPSSTQELQDGDVIILVVGVLITVQWLPVCCYIPAVRGKQSISTEACASLGINVVYSQISYVTHHATPDYTITASIAQSLLLAAQFITSDWLSEVIRLGNLPVNNDPSNGVSLEQTFLLPPIAKFRPAFSAVLPSTLKVFKVWEPNEGRFNMFKGHRFISVDEKPNAELRDMIRCGGGEYEAFIVSGGKQKFHHALSKARRVTSDAVGNGKGLVIVADENAMNTAIGPDAWKELLSEAKSFGLRFIAVENILRSVINLDISLVDSTIDSEEGNRHSSSSLPDFVPNTHPDEPSIAQERPSQPLPSESSRQLRRRAPTPLIASRPPSPQVIDNQEHEVPRPRKVLTRRANAGKPVIIGIDDQSLLIDAEPNASTSTSELIILSTVAAETATPLPARSSRLKRRAGTTVSQTVSVDNIDGIREEPPLKKFKALFEASDPDRGPTGGFGNHDSGANQSLLESVTQTRMQMEHVSAGNVEGLEVVREEEEESQTLESVVRTKRKAGSSEDEDPKMRDRVRVLAGPVLKKRAIEHMNAVEPTGPEIDDPVGARATKPPFSTAKSTKAGAPPGKPDTDAAFLKALASTQRGRKHEDSFDREFNKLKISKPDLGREEHEEEWAVLADFGDDGNVRGNFMVVVEMDIFKKEQSGHREGKVEWEGKVNFKRFKRPTVGPRKTVELVVTEENDYGMGPTYWKGDHSQPRSQNDDFALSQNLTLPRPKVPTQTRSQKGKARTFLVDDSDEGDVQEVMPRKDKAELPKAPPETSKPLFLNEATDALEGVDFGDNIHEDGVQKLELNKNPTSRPSTRARTGAKKKVSAVVIVDDDSDDGATFKGFTGKKLARR